MITARGLPTLQKEHEKETYPVLTWWNFGNGESGYTFLRMTWQTHKGMCCEVKYLSIYCTLCNLCVNIDVPDLKGGIIERIANELHSHDEFKSRLVYIAPNDFNKYKGRYVSAIDDTSTVISVSSPRDIICCICGRNFTNHVYPGYILIDFQLYDNIYGLNQHYMRECTVNKFCQSREDLLSNRTEEIYAIHHAIKKRLNEIVDTPASPRDIETERYYSILVKISRKCHCGEQNILQCAVCGVEWKGTKPSMIDYESIVKQHFGKSHVTCDFRDLIFAENENKVVANRNKKRNKKVRTEQQYYCVICGEEYAGTGDISSDNSLPPKEIVIDHFKHCLEANS